MLRTNLSTRPFYNVRAVRMALGLVGLMLLGAALFNTARLVSLGMSEESLGSRASEAEGEATRLRLEAPPLPRLRFCHETSPIVSVFPMRRAKRRASYWALRARKQMRTGTRRSSKHLVASLSTDGPSDMMMTSKAGNE